MNIFIVFIWQNRDCFKDESFCRWIDSMWADKSHAEVRRDEVLASFKACGVGNHHIFITEGIIADAKLTVERSHHKKVAE